MNWSPDQALLQLKADINRRIEAGSILIQNEMKRVLSVPAPRKQVRSKHGAIYYRAATPAIPGAPPRKLSGRMRSSVSRDMDKDKMQGRVGASVPYAERHEKNGHPWASVAVQNVLPALQIVLGSDIGVS